MDIAYNKMINIITTNYVQINAVFIISNILGKLKQFKKINVLIVKFDPIALQNELETLVRELFSKHGKGIDKLFSWRSVFDRKVGQLRFTLQRNVLQRNSMVLLFSYNTQ